MKHKDRKIKGATFERDVAKIFAKALGIELRRTPLSGGWAKGNPNVSGDIVCVDPGPEALPYSIECKNNEGWRLESLFTDTHKWFDDWWAQAVKDCPTGKTPLLVFSRAYIPIFVALPYSGESYLWDETMMVIELDDDQCVIVMLLDAFLWWR